MYEEMYSGIERRVGPVLNSQPFKSECDLFQQVAPVCSLSLQGESAGWGEDGDLNWDDNSW